MVFIGLFAHHHLHSTINQFCRFMLYNLQSSSNLMVIPFAFHHIELWCFLCFCILRSIFGVSNKYQIPCIWNYYLFIWNMHISRCLLTRPEQQNYSLPLGVCCTIAVRFNDFVLLFPLKMSPNNNNNTNQTQEIYS